MNEYEKIRRMWAWALLTPLLYLGLAWVLENWGWIKTTADAPHPWDNGFGQGVVVAIALGIAVALVWHRLRWSILLQHTDQPSSDFSDEEKSEDSDLPPSSPDPEPQASDLKPRSSHTREFYVMAALSDSLAFMGLFYFAMSGRRWALLVGGVAAYLGYAISHPRRADFSSRNET